MAKQKGPSVQERIDALEHNHTPEMLDAALKSRSHYLRSAALFKLKPYMREHDEVVRRNEKAILRMAEREGETRMGQVSQGRAVFYLSAFGPKHIDVLERHLWKGARPVRAAAFHAITRVKPKEAIGYARKLILDPTFTTEWPIMPSIRGQADTPLSTEREPYSIGPLLHLFKMHGNAQDRETLETARRIYETSPHYNYDFAQAIGRLIEHLSKKPEGEGGAASK